MYLHHSQLVPINNGGPGVDGAGETEELVSVIAEHGGSAWESGRADRTGGRCYITRTPSPGVPSHTRATNLNYMT